MRRAGLEHSQSSSIKKALDTTRAAIDRVHDDLQQTWSDLISSDPYDARIQTQNRLRRLESAYLETRLALRHACDDESQVLLFVLGAKIMHDIADQSVKYDLITTIENPVPESSNLHEASLAWLKRGMVIASAQDEPALANDTEVHDSGWQSPVGSRKHQLDEANALVVQYRQELECRQARAQPSLAQSPDGVILAA